MSWHKSHATKVTIFDVQHVNVQYIEEGVKIIKKIIPSEVLLDRGWVMVLLNLKTLHKNLKFLQ